MARFKLFGSAAILSALSATPAFAERMIDEPGMYAFNYPNGDLGIAATRPATGAQAQAIAPRLIMHHSIATKHQKSK